MAAFSTIALASAAVLGAAGSAYQGYTAQEAGKKARKRQKEAQDSALGEQRSEQREQDIAIRRAKGADPDAGSLLEGESEPFNNSTLLSGGAARQRQRLGRSSLLGG